VALCNDSCASATRESVSALAARAAFFFAALSRAHRCASMRTSNRLWHLDASGSLVAFGPLPYVVGTEDGLLFFFFSFDLVQVTLLLVIRKACCRGYLAALRASVMVAYLRVESSQESLSHG